MKRFEREAKAVTALSHSNILTIYDVGSQQVVSFAVTELLEGETLRTAIAKLSRHDMHFCSLPPSAVSKARYSLTRIQARFQNIQVLAGLFQDFSSTKTRSTLNQKGVDKEMKRISRKNEDMFRLVLENNPYPMWIYDHESLQFREVNPAAVAKYGYTREEFLKMKITEIRPKDQVPRLLAEHKKFRMNLKHIGEWQHLLKDGSLIDVAITAYPLYFGGRNAILVQAQDITERKRAQEVLRKLAVVEERNRIAREIHDTLAQAFTGILVQLEAAQDVLATSRPEANSHISRARSLARKSLAEARRSVWELRPHELEKGDLTLAIKSLANQAKYDGTRIQCSVTGKPRRLSQEIENNLLRISQEALTNIIRHAKATRVQIRLTFKSRNVQLLLQDDGKGFNSGRPGTGFGLIGMRERAQRIGAELILSSRRGRGSKIVVNVPA